MHVHKRTRGKPARRDGGGDEIPDVLKAMLKGGLSLLWRSFEYARDLETESWEFAVGCDSLYQAGLSTIDLRWLVARGYVEFALKAALAPGQTQSAETNRFFSEQDTSFVLTNAGAALAMQILSPRLQLDSDRPSENGVARQGAEVSSQSVREHRSVEHKPSWDRDRKVLLLGESIIKQFRWSAVNQETVLMAFEEEDWPPRIDDPLPRRVNQDSKQRLHDTIKCLNRNHNKRVIHFNGDGTGEGIRWSFLDASERD